MGYVTGIKKTSLHKQRITVQKFVHKKTDLTVNKYVSWINCRNQAPRYAVINFFRCIKIWMVHPFYRHKQILIIKSVYRGTDFIGSTEWKFCFSRSSLRNYLHDSLYESFLIYNFMYQKVSKTLSQHYKTFLFLFKFKILNFWITYLYTKMALPIN